MLREDARLVDDAEYSGNLERRNEMTETLNNHSSIKRLQTEVAQIDACLFSGTTSRSNRKWNALRQSPMISRLTGIFKCVLLYNAFTPFIVLMC